MAARAERLRPGAADVAAERAGFVVLMVYLHPDLAEVMRVMQALVLQRLKVERFNVNMNPIDQGTVKGLDVPAGPVMQLAVMGSGSAHEVERATKALNRIVSVYKVQVFDAS